MSIIQRIEKMVAKVPLSDCTSNNEETHFLVKYDIAELDNVHELKTVSDAKVTGNQFNALFKSIARLHLDLTRKWQKSTLSREEFLKENNKQFIDLATRLYIYDAIVQNNHEQAV